MVIVGYTFLRISKKIFTKTNTTYYSSIKSINLFSNIILDFNVVFKYYFKYHTQYLNT